MYLFVANFFNVDGSECSLRGGNFLEDGRYTLKIQVKIWRDKEVVQNALQLSAAIYKTEPHQYIHNRQNTMTISEIVAIGDLNVNEERQSCIFALESCKNTSSKMTTLYIAMKGSKTSKDWKTNLDF